MLRISLIELLEILYCHCMSLRDLYYISYFLSFEEFFKLNVLEHLWKVVNRTYRQLFLHLITRKVLNLTKKSRIVFEQEVHKVFEALSREGAYLLRGELSSGY